MLKRNELLENLINLRREIRTNHLEKYNEKIIVITDQGLDINVKWIVNTKLEYFYKEYCFL